jgi:hypothetical protein
MPSRPRVPHRGAVPEALGALDHARGGGVGIDRFTAAVSADNAAMAGLLRNFGGDVVRREFGTLEYGMELGGGPGRWARLRADAPGELELS